MRLLSILWALALCGAGWTPGIILSQEPVKDEPSVVSQAEKSKVTKEAIPTQLPNFLPTPDFKSADITFTAFMGIGIVVLGSTDDLFNP